MLVDYPYEWEKYMVDGKVRTFKANTPNDILEQAKKINIKALAIEEKPYFNFSN